MIFFFLKYLDVGKTEDIYLVALNKLYCFCGSWSRMNYLDVLREKKILISPPFNTHCMRSVDADVVKWIDETNLTVIFFYLLRRLRPGSDAELLMSRT